MYRACFLTVNYVKLCWSKCEYEPENWKGAHEKGEEKEALYVFTVIEHMKGKVESYSKKKKMGRWYTKLWI